MQQTDLFDQPPSRAPIERVHGAPFERGNPQSQAGAMRILPYLNTARFKVFEFIKAHPRCCDRDIVVQLDMNPNTVRPRRVELERAGLIRAAGLVKTPDKHADATGWVVTGKEYPTPFPKTDFNLARARSERPTPARFKGAASYFKRVSALSGEAPPPDAVIVLKWITKQGVE